jgi:hypothetical protein
MLTEEVTMHRAGWVLGLVACASLDSEPLDLWSGTVDVAPPPGDLAIEVDRSLIAEETFEIVSTGALPYEQVYVVSNRAGLGDGLCHPRLGGGCLDLVAPIAFAGSMWSDIDGRAFTPLTLTVIDEVRTERCFQAIALRGSDGMFTELTEPVCRVVCGADADEDGVCDGEDTCPGGDDLLDADGDGVCDALDECPMGPDVDEDGDGVIDACEADLTGIYDGWFSEGRYVYAFQSDSSVDISTYETFCEDRGVLWFEPLSAADAQLAITMMYEYDYHHTWIITKNDTTMGGLATWGGYSVTVDSPSCVDESDGGFSAIRKWGCSMCDPEFDSGTTRCWDADHSYDWLLCEGTIEI